MIKKDHLLFWQPRTDFLQFFLKTRQCRRLLVILNYLIWLFLFFISYLLIRYKTNIFWQILTATVLAEVIERGIKSFVFWKRPLFTRQDPIPPGLVKSWYQTGSFPSGHTTKATYFFLFLLQNSVFSPIAYLLGVVPLIFFRVIVGFHYPIDLLGGIIVGAISWLIVHSLIFPSSMVEFIRIIFNFVFFIH